MEDVQRVRAAAGVEEGVGEGMGVGEGVGARFVGWLRGLLSVPSVTGYERPMFRRLEAEYGALGLTTHRYFGTLAVSGDRPGEAVISCHVDRHGLVCTAPGEFEYAAHIVKFMGMHPGRRASQEQLARIFTRFYGRGAVAYNAVTGETIAEGTIVGAEEQAPPRNLVFQIAGMQASAVLVGTPVGYRPELEVGGGRISGQLDNAVSVAVVRELFDRGFRGTAVFTSEEEAGQSWKYLLAYLDRQRIETDRLIVLDTSPYPDAAGAEAQDVVLRRRDAGGVFNQRLAEELEGVCRELGVPHEFKDAYVERENAARAERGEPPLRLGNTELGRVVEATGGQINGATVQLPTHGYHTTFETVTERAVGSVVRVLERVVVEGRG